MDRGCLITFEGPDNVGKSTQIERLSQWLAGRGERVLVAREPGGTELGEQIRALLLESPWEPLPVTEALLFAAARAELVGRVVRPALADGRIVILDRYVDSSVAYQGFGTGVGVEAVRAVNAVATGGLEPVVTLLLLGAAHEDPAGRRDRMERRDGAFQARVRAGYRRLADECSRIQIVEADGAPEAVADRIRTIVEPYLARKGDVRG